MFKGQVVTGTTTGTGSAINIELGFVPVYVRIINKTDPGVYEWMNPMADAEMLKAVDGTVAITFETSDGISVYAGSEGSNSKGFTIGADSDMNAASDVLYYLAIGAE